LKSAIVGGGGRGGIDSSKAVTVERVDRGIILDWNVVTMDDWWVSEGWYNASHRMTGWADVAVAVVALLRRVTGRTL